MRRLLVPVMTMVAVLGYAQIAGATKTLEMSGSSNLALIDDGDGVPETGEDCILMGTLSTGSGNLAFTTTQNNVTNIRICPGGAAMSGTSNCDANACGDDDSSNFADAAITSSTFGGSSIPFYVEFVDETKTHGDGKPLQMNDLLDAVYAGEQSGPFTNPDGIGRFCRIGKSLAVQLTLFHNPSVILPTSYYPSAQSPEYLCIENIPFQVGYTSTRVLRNLYVPVTSDRHLTVGANGVADLLIDIDLDEVPACAGRADAPAVTEWGLMAIVLVLLAVETWFLGRRRSFYQGLPRA